MAGKFQPVTCISSEWGYLLWVMNTRALQTSALVLHLVASVFMLGVIWFVQVVHYPLFAEVGWMTFSSYEQQHAQLTTFIVLPPMTAELVTSAFLFWKPADTVTRTCLWLFPLTVLIWGFTFAIHVPQHEALQNGFDSQIHRQLVLSNWIRTVIWTLKSSLLMAAFVRLLRPFTAPAIEKSSLSAS